MSLTSEDRKRKALHATLKVGERVYVEHEGMGTVVEWDDCSVFVKFDRDGEELSCGYEMLERY